MNIKTKDKIAKTIMIKKIVETMKRFKNSDQVREEIQRIKTHHLREKKLLRLKDISII